MKLGWIGAALPFSFMCVIADASAREVSETVLDFERAVHVAVKRDWVDVEGVFSSTQRSDGRGRCGRLKLSSPAAAWWHVQLLHPIRLVGSPRRIELSMRAGAKLVAHVRLCDALGEVFTSALKPDSGASAANSWRRWSVQLPAQAKSPKLDYRDREIDLPVWLSELRLRSSAAVDEDIEVDEVTVWSDVDDDCTLSLRVATEHLSNVFTEGERVDLRAAVADFLGTDRALRLRWEVKDFWGSVVAVAPSELRVAAGRSAQLDLTLPARSRGYFSVGCTAEDARGSAQAHTSVVILSDEDVSTPDPTSVLGISGIFQTAHLPLARRIGVEWVRDWMHLNWGSIMPAPGKYHWERADAFVSLTERHGIKLLPLIFCVPGWASTGPAGDPKRGRYPARDWAALAEFMERLVDRYKSRLHTWEIWNEPNCTFGWMPKPDPAAYAELFRAAYAGAKKADQRARVIGICPAGRDPKFIRAALEALGKGRMDGLALHPYTCPRSPEEGRFREHLVEAAGLMSEFRAGDSLWLTEVGWSTNAATVRSRDEIDALKRRKGYPISLSRAGGASEQEQASFTARMVTLARSVPQTKAVFYHAFEGLGPMPDYVEHNLGFLRYDGSPKPVVAAYHTLAARLRGLRYDGAVDLAQRDLRAYAFSGRGRDVLVAWTTGPARSLVLKIPYAQFTVYDLMNNPSKAKAEEGYAIVRVSGSPVFLEARQGKKR